MVGAFGSVFFHRVHDGIGHQSRNVSIGQTVKHMFAIATRTDDPLTLEDSQTLRNRRHRFPKCVGKFGDATGPRFEHDQESETLRVAKSAKNRGRALASCVVDSDRMLLVILSTAGGRFFFAR